MSRRRFGTKPRQGRVVVVTFDGEKTEADYFRNWKLLIGPGKFIVKPIFVKSGGNALSAMKASLRAAKAIGDYDELWCVCDADDSRIVDLNEARQLAEKHHANICISTRSFEVWIAAHFARSGSPIENEAQAIALVARFLPNYTSKKKVAEFEELFPRTQDAISNSRWLEQMGFDNPTTSVHRLVERLVTLAEENS